MFNSDISVKDFNFMKELLKDSEILLNLFENSNLKHLKILDITKGLS